MHIVIDISCLLDLRWDPFGGSVGEAGARLSVGDLVRVWVLGSEDFTVDLVGALI